jgi:tetratricopeptide (TPR) repeat protein
MSMGGNDRRDQPDGVSGTTIETLEDLGDFHRAADGFGSALEYYDSALRALGAESKQDVHAEARLNRKLSECYSSRGQLQEGLQYLDRAQACLAGCENEVEYAIVLGARAHVCTLLGDWRDSLANAAAAIELLKPTSAHAECAMVQAIAALCHGRLGNQKEFEELSTDALATYRRIDDQAGIAKLNNNLGIVYKNSCQWEQAIACLTAALAINDRIGRGRGLARVLTNLGNVYTKTHHYEQALVHLHRGRRLAQSLGDQATLTSILNSLGHALVLTGRYASAE